MFFGGWKGLKYFKYHFQFNVDKDHFLLQRDKCGFLSFHNQEKCGDLVTYCLKSHFPLN